MTKQRAKIPRGLFDPNGSGMLDTDKITPAEKMLRPTLAAEAARRRSPDPTVRKLQAATDKALGRAR